MVLMLIRAIALSALVAAVAGCVPQRPPVRAEQGRHKMAIAYVVDSVNEHAGLAVPEALRSRVRRAVEERNVTAHELDSGAYRGAFAAKRLTSHRLEHVARLAPDADLLLLVEAFPRFYSLLNGRYRWTVQVKLSLARRDATGDAMSEDVSLPIFLTYAHEREHEALEQAASSVGRELGPLLDDFIAGLPATPVQGDEVAAPASPPPTENDAIYFVLVDRYSNGDPGNDGEVDPASPMAWHGGDLHGVIEHLDELQELGIGTVWLSPVFDTRDAPFFEHGAFHGYWVEDLGAVEPRCGDEATLVELADELRRRGMRLYLDMVLNHVGYDAPLLSEHPEWFHGHGAIQDWGNPEQLLTYDVHGLPDLAQERGDVYAHLLDKSKHWIERVRPAGFRLDAVKHIPMDFWARYNADVAELSGGSLATLGELLDGNPATIQAGYQQGRFSSLFDFPLYFAMVDVFCRGQHPGRLASVLYADRGYRDPQSLVTLLDNHDLPRILSACGGDAEKVRNAFTFQLTARGAPSITYGSEVGLEGEEEPANRADMRFESQHPTRQHIQALLAARRAQPALRQGLSRILAVDDDLFAYVRMVDQQAVVVGVNQSGRAKRIELPAGLSQSVHRDLVRGRDLGGGRAVALAPHAVTALLLTPAGEESFADVVAAERHRAAQPEMVDVIFEVAALPALAPGDRLSLVGAGPELGAWSPAAALPFSAAVGSGGQRLTVALPRHGAFGYKLLIRRADGSVSWEDGDNRNLFVGPGANDAPVALEFRQASPAS